jgi:RHS repeat-associated protein
MVDQILADEGASGQVLWPLTDHLGTVRDLVDSAGAVQNHISYDSFGRVTAETNAATDFLFGFTGRELDQETGLHYYRARYYDDGTGRLLGPDPIGFDSGDTNVFRYVGNNPVSLVDPLGMQGAPAPAARRAPAIESANVSYCLPILGWSWTRDDTIGFVQGLTDAGWGALNFLPGGVDFFATYSSAFGAAQETAVQFGKEYGRTPGETNTLQHVMWQAMLTYWYSEDDAKAIGDKHESWQDYGNEFRRQEQQADYKNNEIGREIGRLVAEYKDNEVVRKDPVGVIKKIIKDYFDRRLLDVSGGQGGGMGIGPQGGKGRIHTEPGSAVVNGGTRQVDLGNGLTYYEVEEFIGHESLPDGGDQYTYVTHRGIR